MKIFLLIFCGVAFGFMMVDASRDFQSKEFVAGWLAICSALCFLDAFIGLKLKGNDA